ncbi:SGNH/GDSL hydrolase family protein [Hymenobacter metallilatus]|uniref:SGNH hydrolase-type esterase domain-containing protein n=1 Tax=Hymenobacter metallilatus TaxID=2493666 RepID=A0A428JLW2_9BACT|nr:GDSL-type esterase/lipase family protein [Hymenobacter metallilatus]RSK33951.1 hypothetical protein EI290_09605 [Hymenobacter metallilatus]
MKKSAILLVSLLTTSCSYFTPQTKITFVSNSLMAGDGGYKLDEKILAELKHNGVRAVGQNLSVGGTTTAQLATRMAEINAAWDNSKQYNVLLVWEQTNQLYFGASPLQADSTLRKLITDATAVHPWKVVVATVLPRANDGTPPDQETKRIKSNQMLRINHTGWQLADVAANTEIGEPGDCLNSKYYYDKVHLNDAGQQIEAPIFAEAIEKALK